MTDWSVEFEEWMLRVLWKRRQRRRKRAYKRSAGLLPALVLLQGSRCALCGEPFAGEANHMLKASVDHIIPISRGGTSDRANLQAAHRICNMRKGNKI